MKTLWFVGLVVILLPAVVFFAGQFGMLKGKSPGDLGVHNGRLKPPSSTPNSVSSQAGLYPEHPQREYADISPLHYQGDGASALRKLADIVRALPATTVVTETSDYLYAQSTTPTLKFTDDVEFWLNPAEQVIHVRSASRIGRKDFAVNRARVESIRAQFEKN
ncbi:MAG: DUF1499 domain-containing protein [Rhodoferax sp.]|uniref:DUF1499 domain-containing protein n=1 Tax=Rhodoferax sp. TaxID=50421 RepID=UPI002ACDE5CB|nr:DUF1499 domain-containing protein [Rhodoferax sp.]MDZ7892594.1 DUF1499 domain-containing protein [Rhodoferax sp.]